MLFGATMPSSGWSAPDVAPLLAPPPPASGVSGRGGVRAPDRDSPADLRRAIADVVPLLPHSVSEAGALAARASRLLLGAIERCDAEVAALCHDASDGEVDRLTA